MTTSIRDLDLHNKRVLIRVDFNVPLDSQGVITDDTRIVASLPTIAYVLQQQGKVILISHLGRPKGKSKEYSLMPCAKRLSELLGKPVLFAPDCIGDEVEALIAKMNPGEVVLLENVRFYPAEEKPEVDPSFAAKLARLADVYINDAFGTAHRAHSSTTTVATYFPGKAAAGFLLEKEINFLGTALKTPKRPFYAIIGGAKVSTKIGVLKSLITKVDALMLGGCMSYTFLKAQGIPVGDSPIEEDQISTALEIIEMCRAAKVKLYLPKDVVAATQFQNDASCKTFTMPSGIEDGYQGMDIGPKTLEEWSHALAHVKTVIWNGPVGVFEFPNFAKGTFGLAKRLAELKKAVTIVGGGDSIAALQQIQLTDAMTHISTGGGASLEYMEFGTLPGIEVLANV
jgi:phosphoglycerate kinase